MLIIVQIIKCLLSSQHTTTEYIRKLSIKYNILLILPKYTFMCSRIFNSNSDRTVFSLFYANEFFLYSLFACQFHLRIQMLPNLFLADVITFLSSHAYTTSILVFMHRNTHFKFIRDYLCKSRIRKFWHFYCNLTLKTSRIILSYNQH